jgi:Ulp1 family protease
MQKNSHDCGVFAIMFANYIGRDGLASIKDWRWSQDDMPFLRRRVLRQVNARIDYLPMLILVAFLSSGAFGAELVLST